MLSELQAKILATVDPSYVARKIRGRWVVWCVESDHMVEFDPKTVERLTRAPMSREEWRKR